LKKKIKEYESSKVEIEKVLSSKDGQIKSLQNKVNELESINKKLVQTLNVGKSNNKINFLKSQDNNKNSNLDHLSHSPFSLSKESEQIIKNNEKLNQKGIVHISRKATDKITSLLTTRDHSKNKKTHPRNQENNAIIANSRTSLQKDEKESQNEKIEIKLKMINEKYCNLQKQLTERSKKVQISNTLVNSKKNLSKSPLIRNISIARNKLGHENKTTFLNNDNNLTKNNLFEKDQRSLSITQLKKEINDS